MTPTLIVPGPAEDWLPLPPTGQCRCTGQCHGGHTWSLGAPPLREWVPVTTLPTVHRNIGNGIDVAGIISGPLRAGDTVTLYKTIPDGVDTFGEHHCAGSCVGCGAGVDEACQPPCACDEGGDCLSRFATAEVGAVVPAFSALDMKRPTPYIWLGPSGTVHLIAGDEEGDHEIIDVPGGSDWSSAQYGVRLTNVEALSGHVDSAVTPEEAQALRVESINERHARRWGGS